MQIAIDGPAGAGKTSVSKELAKRLKIMRLDTGAMYRALGYKIFRMGIDPEDEKEVSYAADNTNIDLQFADGEQRVILDGEDITHCIRTPQISMYASTCSKHKNVRIKMVQLQQRIASTNDVVAEGRDIGTHVLPDAEYKFHVTASTTERANRRYKELLEKGEKPDLEELINEIEKRDYQDMNRDYAPLKAADDAVIIDTSNLNFEQVIQKILEYLRE